MDQSTEEQGRKEGEDGKTRRRWRKKGWIPERPTPDNWLPLGFGLMMDTLKCPSGCLCCGWE